MNSKESFEAEALPHLDAVYRFALRLGGSEADAEDLVQETFLRAYRAWHQYTPGTRAKSWLFTICRNVFLRQRQRDDRRTEVVQQAAVAANAGGASHDADGFLFAHASAVDPEGEFFRGIIDDSIMDAIDRLPTEFRDAVVLSDLEGLSYAEAARVLDVPVGTVKSRLYRGRRLLQQALYEYAAEQGYIRTR
ncbi:MAG TPA: sigma-70 family RNA polymerase sigma factor [Longimicrobiales bacterium]